MTLEHATHTTYKITRFDSEEWLNYNKKERSKPLKNEPNCLKPESAQFLPVTTSSGTYLRTPDAKTKASMLSYMRSLSPQVSIDADGYVTKKQ